MTIEWLASGSFMLSLATQAIMIYLSHRHSLFIDSPSEKKPQRFHDLPTPRAGGVGILVGLFTLLLTPWGWKLLLSTILAFGSGIFEDFHRSLSPTKRLIMQLFASLGAIVLTNAVVTYIGMGVTLPYTIGIFFSAFAIVGMMNALNIIDGFNGLAAGVAMLILASFTVAAMKVDDTAIFQLNIIAMATIAGFLVFNFPVGRIFLGDGGAYLLGFVVALSGIFLASHHDKISPWYVLCVLIYPVWEVIFSIIRKRRAGRSPMQPDAYHMHMLINKHLTKNNPLTALLIWILYAPFALVPALYPNNSTANFLTALCFIVCYLVFYAFLVKKEFKS